MATAKNTEQLNVGIGAELMAELREFVRARNEKVRNVVELALRRHLDNPPAMVEVPPLPPVVAPAPEQKKKGKKK